MRSEIEVAFERVLSSGWFVLGPENDALSEELSSFLGTPNTVLVGNGTDAIEIALVAIGVPPGSSVLTVANAGGYSSTAIRQVGAIPVYVDIDPISLQMSVDSLEDVLAGLSTVPSAIIVTHLFGYSAPVEAICTLAKRYEIPVVEDCAQSLGAIVSGRRLGTFGHIATTSFYPTKNLGALGDGGAIFTANTDYANRARSLRQYGWTEKYRTGFAGGRNSRLDELQAAVLRVRLPLLDGFNKSRRRIHSLYRGVDSELGKFPHASGENFVAHLGVMITDDRGHVRSEFAARNIETDIHYPVPDHLQTAYRDSSTQSLLATEGMAGRILTVPLFSEMSDDEVEQVMETLRG